MPVRSTSTYLLPLIIVFIFYVVLTFSFEKSTFMHTFFLQAWYVQAASTWLFFVGLWQCLQRYLSVGEAKDALQWVDLPNDISQADAVQLVEQVSARHKETITVRRLLRILDTCQYREDFSRLNEELSQRDSTELARGHLLLDSLKNVIPVIGFLGTVIGLSLGMLYFPDIANIDELRKALKGFAQSLGIAFNTTLLALAYTIVLIILTTVLKENERQLLEQLDELSSRFISRIKINK